MAKEMRLIAVDALKERIRQEPTDGMYTAEILEAIDEVPIVDAVEVVRCRDCKYGMKSYLQPRHEKNYLCRHSWEGEYHKPDHFCAYGEKVSDNKG